MNPRNFFSELKRRNVYKVAVAYAVVGWLVIQISSTVLPTFHAPEWVAQTLVLLVVLGFPIALVLAWAFELTPEGVKRMEDVGAVAEKRGKSHAWIYVVVVGVALSLGLFFLGRSTARDNAAPRRSEAATAPIPQKSIAVLPLENLSRDPDNAYFADGMQDEILTRLSKIAALKVISRSSTLKYKSAPENLREVGKQLGVANLLEGSVQRIGNTVQVNVQLIRAATDEHLWAESYQRTLNDVFAVEAEVASAIAEQLNAKLSGSERKAITDRPTKNPAAYEAYLRGVSLDVSFVSIPRLQQAAREYEEAIRLDPSFGIAWARLARARGSLRFLGSEVDTNTASAVQRAAERAMALAPEAGETWLAQGAYRGIANDPAGAVVAYQEAQKRMPNNALVYLALGFGERRLGRWLEAEASFNKALELDPRNITVLDGISEFYGYLRRYDKALSLIDRAIAIGPEFESARAFKADLLRKAGRLTEAGAELRRIPADSTDRWVLDSRAAQATYERSEEDANRSAILVSAFPPEQRNARERNVLLKCAYCLLDAGRIDQARDIFQRVLDEESAADKADLSLVAAAQAGLGQKDKAIETARRGIERLGDLVLARQGAEIDLAAIQARQGEKEAALAVLPHLLEAPGILTIADLKFNPAWDSLRDDPRFQKLLTLPEHVGP